MSCSIPVSIHLPGSRPSAVLSTGQWRFQIKGRSSENPTSRFHPSRTFGDRYDLECEWATTYPEKIRDLQTIPIFNKYSLWMDCCCRMAAIRLVRNRYGPEIEAKKAEEVQIMDTFVDLITLCCSVYFSFAAGHFSQARSVMAKLCGFINNYCECNGSG